jgi:hypothetical protein
LVALGFFGWTIAAAEIRGVVIKADDKKQELTIDGRGKGARGLVLKFTLDQDTEILVDKKPGKVADLVPGKRVRVVYDLQDGRRVARLITLHGNAAAAAPALAPSSRDANTVAGTLRRVAITDRELVVVNAGPKGGAELETTIQVPESIKISRDQKSIRFEDLKEGEQVSVATEKKDGTLTARSIQVGAAPAANSGSGEERRIERLRQILKMVDEILQRMDERQ